jgi:GNAT superfamily N-acetyltransferase
MIHADQPGCIIRRANPGDARSIAAIHIQSWRETYPGIVPDEILARQSLDDREMAWAQILLGGPPHHKFTFVAEDATKSVCGFASGGAFRRDPESESSPPGVDLGRFDGELHAIYVLQAQQKKGLGAGLFRAVRRELISQGYQSMFVWVLERNASRAFYERMGGVAMASKRIKIGVWMEEKGYGWERLDSMSQRFGEEGAVR